MATARYPETPRDSDSTVEERHSSNTRVREREAARLPDSDEPPVLRRRSADEVNDEESRSRHAGGAIAARSPIEEEADEELDAHAAVPAVRDPVVERRSRRASAAIIGGGAVLGAVIGGITGGGKGAVIGAASGGAGGYVLDRLTRRK